MARERAARRQPGRSTPRSSSLRKSDPVSVYRRSLRSTNLVLPRTIMFDGRETIAPPNHGVTFFDNLVTDLTDQATDATLIHAQAAQAPCGPRRSPPSAVSGGDFDSEDRRCGFVNSCGSKGVDATMRAAAANSRTLIGRMRHSPES
jgi:hypothetical protein